MGDGLIDPCQLRIQHTYLSAMPISPPLIASVTALTLILLHGIYEHRRKPRLRLPPSPKSYPLIGHLLSIPQEAEYLEYMEIGKQLGSELTS